MRVREAGSGPASFVATGQRAAYDSTEATTRLALPSIHQKASRVWWEPVGIGWAPYGPRT